MAIIVKCDTPTVGMDFTFSVEVRPVGDVSPSPGDEVFVWTSEGGGGQGLFMRGKVEAAHVSRVNRKASLRIRATADVPPGTLTNRQLEPHKDSAERSPLAKLARKLVKNTLNKVADLDADEARYLRAFFRRV